jgi:hypothetical protein
MFPPDGIDGKSQLCPAITGSPTVQNAPGHRGRGAPGYPVETIMERKPAPDDLM